MCISALEWTRTTTPLGTGPQPAAYTIPPRGQTLRDYAKHITPTTKICQLFIRPVFQLSSGEKQVRTPPLECYQ